MPYPKFDRSKVKMKSLKERKNRVFIECDAVNPDSAPPQLSDSKSEILEETIQRIKKARENEKPVVLAFGAHTIKNGLSPVIIELMKSGWITHLATNGAGIIHDWEFAWLGESSEDVKANVEKGEFGNWEETGFYLNLAINVGAYEGKGYGESVGAMIENESLIIPSIEFLQNKIKVDLEESPEQVSVTAELISILQKHELETDLKIPHQWKQYSLQAAAFRMGIPFTAHPMFGHDIIYNHSMNNGVLLGRAAERDFLTFAENISNIDGGVYISVGSAVMSPMIFEKSYSMSQNVALQSGDRIENHYILVVDLAASNWDWSKGEPPESDPAYYLRFNKTFNRMGGKMNYLSLNNRDFLLNLNSRLK